MKTKRIVDSVHGNIYIEDKYFDFIDTEWFQRLRRIEQSSIRSIFPCARHDRFSHSIGVFYMGQQINGQIYSEACNNYYKIAKSKKESKKKFDVITNSYLIACLLHDIAHAPFSHSFESYYGDTETLCKKLNKLLDKNEKITFSNDDYDRIKEHEIVSAILIVENFKDKINTEFEADCCLVARMIIGQMYSNDTTTENQIRNCYISLLNGCAVDADRLDYAHRDIWASGYKTASLDFERLISSIYIRKNKDTNKYVVCFSVNVVNEIMSLIQIRKFQVSNVFNHHTILYEQYLFNRAAQRMTECLKDGKEKKLYKIINYDTLRKRDENPNGIQLHFKISRFAYNTITFHMVADEDLLFLMKQTPKNDEYVEWATRNYKMCSLWETEEEFFYRFPKKDKYMGPKDKDVIEKIENTLSKYGFTESEYHVHPHKRKHIDDYPDVYVITETQDVVKYHKYINCTPLPKYSDDYFYYVYVNKVKWKSMEKKVQNRIIKELGSMIIKKCSY